MNLDAPLSLIVSHLPPPPPPLSYQGTLDTYQGIPGVYVSVIHGEYTIFGSFIPLADLYFLQNTPSAHSSANTHIYYEFVENGVIEVPMSTQEIRDQVHATITELSRTFQAFFDIFVPLTSEDAL